MPLHTLHFPAPHFYDAASLFVLKHCASPFDPAEKGYFHLPPETIALREATFRFKEGTDFAVALQLEQGQFSISCGCGGGYVQQLCPFQARVLLNLDKREDLRLFFDDELRHRKIAPVARLYGLENEDPDLHFRLVWKAQGTEIVPADEHLLPVTAEGNRELSRQLLTEKKKPVLPDEQPNVRTVLVLKQHKYYRQFQPELAEASLSTSGKLKNPVKLLDPFPFIWTTTDPDLLKFYTAIARFRSSYTEEQEDPDTDALHALVKNPGDFPVYYHDTTLGESISSSSLVPVTLTPLPVDLHLLVDRRDSFYDIRSQLFIDGQEYDLSDLPLRYGHFILRENTLYAVSNPDFLRVMSYFKKHRNKISIHQAKFDEFRTGVLAGLENSIRISYTYLREATAEQLQEAEFDGPPQRLLYLSDTENTVWIAPVMKYGPVEVSVRSMKNVYGTDKDGRPFLVNRDREAETAFLSVVMRQHPFFAEQHTGDSFYLHKKRFLDENWFPDAFEEWQRQGITVLGFNSLSKNKLNPHKAKINIRVKSGLDWFETWTTVYYGKQKVPLSQLQKSVRNKNRFVRLDDGTQGILPAEWLEKFAAWFEAGEVADDVIRTPKINFSAITELYDDELLDDDVKMELSAFNSQIASFDAIREVSVPEGLQGTLRDYQKQGLHWLNFLDDFAFGGCLADDMGLGKTIQVLAFFLHLAQKRPGNTHLVVVPTTLLSNWQQEAAKFAPGLRVRTIYGSDRLKDVSVLDDDDLVLTSYGTLVNDIRLLKQYVFDYIVLDESQTIKNPDSMRYQAVKLLRSRNKLVLTGTPIENNTFDLYGQLSFACPGLLGNRTYFREIYAIPIDQFKDARRARELRKKVSPFILRRTKKQVATELPDKTEMVLYCEMEPAQKEVYDTYKREYREFLLTQREDELPRHSMHILKGITNLRQICNSPALLNDGPFYGESSAKIRVLLEEIESKAPEHKILVFSQFVGMLDLIKKELLARNIRFEYLTGQTTRRGEKVATFQDDPTVRVFLISLKAGGTGLNLTEADYVYLVDPWWNPAVENQAIDRAYRIGQQKHVVAVRLICPGTIEEKMMLIQESKKGLAGELVKTDQAAFKQLSKKDLVELFS